MNETRSSLLARVRDPRDHASWREFDGLYRPILQAYVRRTGLADADADDVVQLIFERLLQALPGFHWDRAGGRFRTWLWRVMHNAVVDWRRKNSRARRAEHEAALEQPTDTAPEEPASWGDELRRRVLQSALEGVRQKTRPGTWAAFQGHVLEGRASAEVAAALGTTVNVVDVNSSRVLARVKERCRDYLEDLDDDVEIQF